MKLGIRNPIYSLDELFYLKATLSDCPLNRVSTDLMPLCRSFSAIISELAFGSERRLRLFQP